MIEKDRSITPKLRTRERARRIAWRTVNDWTEAQNALIQTGVVAAEEAFLPYQVVGNGGETVYDKYLLSDRTLPMKNDKK